MDQDDSHSPNHSLSSSPSSARNVGHRHSATDEGDEGVEDDDRDSSDHFFIEALRRRLKSSAPARPPIPPEDEDETESDEEGPSSANARLSSRAGPIYPWFGRPTGSHIDPNDPAGSALRLPHPAIDDDDEEDEEDEDYEEIRRERIRNYLSERYKLRLLALRAVPGLNPPPRPTWISEKVKSLVERTMDGYDVSCDGSRREAVRNLILSLDGSDDVDADEFTDEGFPQIKRRRRVPPPPVVEAEVADTFSLTDVETIESARSGETSMFLSILSALEMGCRGPGSRGNAPPFSSLDISAVVSLSSPQQQGISANRLIRASYLAVPPGCVPPGLDAREFVLVAIRFLCCRTLSFQNYSGDNDDAYCGSTLVSDTLPNLPLMKHVWPTDGGLALDLDRRNYVPVYGDGPKGNGAWSVILPDMKAVNDDMTNITQRIYDFRRKVLNLEAIFLYHHPMTMEGRCREEQLKHPLSVMGRERSCPRVGWDLESNIMLTGSITSRGIPSSMPALAGKGRAGKTVD